MERIENVDTSTEIVVVSRKRQRKPSLKVTEAAASNNGADRTSRRRRRRKTAKVESSEDGSEPSTASSQSSVVETGDDANSRRSAVTTTKLVAKIWREYFSRCEVEGVKKKTRAKGKKVDEKWMPYYQASKKKGGRSSRKGAAWIAGATGVTADGDALYGGVSIDGVVVSPGCVVLVKQAHGSRDTCVCFVEFMFESSDNTKVVHGRVMVGGFETVLGDNADKKELCLTEDCIEFEPSDVIKPLDVKIQQQPWGHQHKRSSEADREKPELGMKVQPAEYFCRNVYSPDKGGFFSLKAESLGLANGDCHSCKARKLQEEKNSFSYCASTGSFTYQGVRYDALDFLYISPLYFEEADNDDNESVSEDEESVSEEEEAVSQDNETVSKEDDNSRTKAYAVCQFLSVEASSLTAHLTPDTVNITVRRFYRPEDLHAMDAYVSDIHTIYCSERKETVPVTAVMGQCKVKTKEDFEFLGFPYINDHTFFCDYVVIDPDQKKKMLPINLYEDCLKLKDTSGNTEEKDESGSNHKVPRSPLATLDIFSGCGGLSEGLEKSGASVTRWAIEFDQMAAEAFKLNHPDAYTVVEDCNVVLRDAMIANGDADDCIPSTEASSSASKLDDEVLSRLPRPGDVDFIIAGPPCQGFSVLNRYKKTSMSDAKRTMILSLLSYVDYFRPKYILVENVRNLVSFDNMNPFQLTIKSFVEMGYQVRFGVLEAGYYGVAQSRRRVFIWAALPEETLPEWPQPLHAFPTPKLRIKLDLDAKSHYTAVRGTKDGAPLRALTVRDTIGDLPELTNGDNNTAAMAYKDPPVSWFQKRVRGNLNLLNDHAAKKLSEVNLIQVQYLRTGEDWRNLPDKKVYLQSKRKFVDLKPQWLVRFMNRGYQSQGVLGRLHWDKNFPTAITNPQPRGKVGRWFHPTQNRMISVREYARSQGFPDWYRFVGSLKNKYQQVGNAVPPPLAFALGRKLRVAMEDNNS